MSLIYTTLTTPTFSLMNLFRFVRRNGTVPTISWRGCGSKLFSYLALAASAYFFQPSCCRPVRVTPRAFTISASSLGPILTSSFPAPAPFKAYIQSDHRAPDGAPTALDVRLEWR